MGRRHLARELALKVLFELEADGGDVERSLQYHLAESRADAEVADFARTLIFGVREHQADIDAHLAEVSRNWGLDQMAKVERTLLRIAAFEIRYLPSVPLKAAINESIELAKTFGGPDSGKFVNGILGRIAADEEVRRHPDEAVAQMDYETAAAELERTVQQLGKEQEDLAESVRTFERGLALARRCARLLDEAERRLNELAPAGERPPGP